MSSFPARTQAGCRRSFPSRLLHRITTVTFGACLVVILQPLYTQALAAESNPRPNIVLIMADDMGYECVQANGCLDYRTPELDRLAASGVRFEHCYSQPICTPSRVKLMTGMSNKRNYVRFGMLDRQQTTFAHLLKKAGYRTAIAGKWQLGGEKDSPQHFGFEQSLLWQHTRPRTDKDKHDTRYPNPRLERNGKELDFDNGEFSSDLFSDFLLDFMEENKDQPFLAYYPMALVHCPFSATPDSEEWDPKSRGSQDYKGNPKYFGDMVAYVDKTVAKIDAKLAELGIRDNTLLIFTGDNGTDTPIATNTTWGKVAGAKGQMIDAGNHVTCIVSWPSVIREGRVVQDIIDFSDMLPTLCAAAGAEVPAHLRIDGQSFLPLLQGRKFKSRDSIYMWYSRNGVVNQARAFARNQTWKLYESGELFDISHDPLEKQPLDPESLTKPEQQVRAMLQSRIDQFTDVVPPGCPQTEDCRQKEAEGQGLNNGVSRDPSRVASRIATRHFAALRNVSRDKIRTPSPGCRSLGSDSAVHREAGGGEST
ncbi:sulfatase-like hydrolase/transferase [bacterium]|nr:sulfatase-like hydrolase/transferase [bacterium]